MQTFSRAGYTQLRILLRSGEPLAWLAPGVFIRDELGADNYIALIGEESGTRISMLMTEQAGSAIPRTRLTGYMELLPEYVGQTFQLKGYFADDAGNAGSLDHLRLRIIEQSGEPVATFIIDSRASVRTATPGLAVAFGTSTGITAEVSLRKGVTITGGNATANAEADAKIIVAPTTPASITVEDVGVTIRI